MAWHTSVWIRVATIALMVGMTSAITVSGSLLLWYAFSD